MKKNFGRTMHALDDVFEFLKNFAGQHDLDTEDYFALQLVTEELFTNFVKYNRNEQEKITIDLEKKGQKIVLTFVDSTDRPFDLNNARPYDTTQELDERPIGKIGIHLIHKYVDNIEQEYKNNRSTIRLIKNLRH
jgi:serine/threonine-protein kinase RsbW